MYLSENECQLVNRMRCSLNVFNGAKVLKSPAGVVAVCGTDCT
jgi:hypothetical protein